MLRALQKKAFTNLNKVLKGRSESIAQHKGLEYVKNLFEQGHFCESSDIFLNKVLQSDSSVDKVEMYDTHVLVRALWHEPFQH